MIALHNCDCLEWLTAADADSVDLVIGSPPYAEKGERYGGTKPWPTAAWVDWMLSVTTQAVRVSRGYVLWVVNGAVRGGRYLPACEGLVWEAHKAGIPVERPAIWHKNPPPNRKDWFANAWEFVLAFKGSDHPYFDWEAVAEPPKYTNGGRFRQRTSNGTRRLGNEYPQNELARPRDVFYVAVGGGHLGHPLAHENEAPYPVKLVEPFILACCPSGGVVLDPFIGGGTTAQAAAQHGRHCIGIDCRADQIDLTNRRIAATQELLF